MKKTWNVEFNSLIGLPSHIQNDIDSAVMDVVRSGQYLLGKQTDKFESEFAALVKGKYCISLDNGTNALILALRALGITSGHKVATVPNAGGYSTLAIKAVGAKPVYVDIDYNTMNMDKGKFSELLQTQDGSLKAVILTHLYGRPADPEILKMADLALILSIEDCSHAHGALYDDGRPVGSVGDVGCFSFYPTKIIGALGDAGAIVTRNKILAERVRSLRQYGWDKNNKYVVTTPGGSNSRMDEMQAAVLRVKIRNFDTIRSQRDRVSCIYSSNFNGKSGLNIPDKRYTPYVYVVRVDERCRNLFIQQLELAGIETAIHYPVLDYSHNGTPGKCPVAETVCKEIVSLPMYPGMGVPQIQTVCKGVLKAIAFVNSVL